MNRKLLPAYALLLLCSLALAQDPALLRPPKGAQVALVVFQDLECPKCRIDSPLEEQAAKAHKIPLVLHDFPLPMHKWSFNAAVIAAISTRNRKNSATNSAITSFSTSRK